MTYDYLIVGAGLYGAVLAREMTDRGYRCLVIDRRAHIAGNAYTEDTEGIVVHRYGAHIFHTNDEGVWAYVNRFARFNGFINSPIANYKGEIYNLPFNMNTFSRMWGVSTPAQAKAKIASQLEELDLKEITNCEEQALSLVGRDVYEKLIRGYTHKQWGRPCKELPAFIIKRLPVRFTYDNNYFCDRYQGIPEGGYTKMVLRMLEGVEVRLGTQYRDLPPDIARRTVYTGCIDEFFEYCLGELEYRSLRFETETLPEENHQGVAVVNYTDEETPYTRVIEHKHFEFGTQEKTIITREYPMAWEKGREPYYPVNDEKNAALFARYRELAKTRPDVRFGGRLGSYCYYDMDQVIAQALADAEAEAAQMEAGL